VIEFKPSVDLRGIQPEVALALTVAGYVFAEYRVPLVVTAVRDGRHMAGSRHYSGMAADLRLPSRYSALPGIDKVVVSDLTKTLGDQFDVVLEPDHIHLEFDPQNPEPPPVA
jgi:hypothetical protein